MREERRARRVTGEHGQAGVVTITVSNGYRRDDVLLTTVLVADGHQLFRSAIAAALGRDGDIEVVGEASTCDEAERMVKELTPTIAYLDADLPGTGALELCASIKSSPIETRVLIVSEEADHELLLAAVEAGADAYLAKDAPVETLLDAARRASRGEAWIPPQMLGVLLRDLIQRRREEEGVLDRIDRLSRREREVLVLLIDGLDHEGIASELVVSPHTARTHIQNILQKLEVHSRLEAVALAHRHDLLNRLRKPRR